MRWLLAILLLAGMSSAQWNTGGTLFNQARVPVTIGTDDSLHVRWLHLDENGDLFVAGMSDTLIIQQRQLYPYFTSVMCDTSLADTAWTFPLPVISFGILNPNAADTLYVSTRGPSYPNSYISILPLASLWLDNVSLQTLYLDSSVDSLWFDLVVLSDSLWAD